MLLHSKTLSHKSVAAFFTNLFHDHFYFKSYVPAGSAPPKSFSHPVFRTPEE